MSYLEKTRTGLAGWRLEAGGREEEVVVMVTGGDDSK